MTQDIIEYISPVSKRSIALAASVSTVFILDRLGWLYGGDCEPYTFLTMKLDHQYAPFIIYVAAVLFSVSAVFRVLPELVLRGYIEQPLVRKLSTSVSQLEASNTPSTKLSKDSRFAYNVSSVLKYFSYVVYIIVPAGICIVAIIWGLVEINELSPLDTSCETETN